MEYGPELDTQDPCFGRMLATHRPKIRFPGHYLGGIEPSELECVELFMHDGLIQHLLYHTNATIQDDQDKITVSEMRKWIGTMFAMTISPVSNISDLWKEQEDGFRMAHCFGMKTGLGHARFKFIRKHFATGPIGAGSKTFDEFRPIQQFFNDRVADYFHPGVHIVIDESTSGWHGKDETRKDGPPALTHMKGKPESVSFMFKNICCVETGIMIAIELQEGKEVMATRRYTSSGEKSSTGVILRLVDYLPGAGFILTGDAWFATLNALRKMAERGHL